MRRMKVAPRWMMLIVSIAALLVSGATAGSASPSTKASTFGPRQGTIGGIVPPAPALDATAFLGSGNLSWHGGPVMHTNHTYAIYWTPVGWSFPAGYETTMNQFFTDVAHDSGASTNVYGTDTQYYDGSGNIAYNSTFVGSTVATDAYPASGCSAGSPCLTDAQLQNEIKKVVVAKGWPQGDGISAYFLFTPQGVNSCFDAGSTQCSYSYYCAYHGSFTPVGGQPIIYANQPYNDVSGCTAGQHPNGNAADSTINVVSHEHNESITDPNLNAWYDLAGYENGDKCAWIFGTASGPSGAQYNQTINGHHYYLQEEWDNATQSCLQQSGGGGGPVTVTSVKPGAVGQGAAKVTEKITGTGFASGATVSISGSGVIVDSVSFVSSTQLNATIHVASGAATGNRNVTVTNPSTSSGTCSSCLTVDPGPAVTSVVPSAGVRGTTIPVQILGSNFVNHAKAKFGKGVTVNSVTFINSGELDVSITIGSAAKTGTRTVTVTNPDKGAGSLSNAFTVN